MFLIIIYFSNYLINNNKIDENDKRFENNPLFGLNQNEKCSQNSFEHFSNELNLLDFDNHCFNIENNIYIKNYSKTNLIIRFLNKQNSNDLLNRFISEIKTSKQFHNCILSGRINLILWNDLSEDNKKDNSILFDKKNFNIIIDIDELSSQFFQYDIIVEMPQREIFKEKLKMKIDNSFLQKHQHPSEQIVFLHLFKNKN